MFAEIEMRNICIWFTLFLSLQGRQLECVFRPLQLSLYFLKGKVKIVPVHAVRVCRGSEDIVLFFLQVSFRWRWMVTFTPRLPPAPPRSSGWLCPGADLDESEKWKFSSSCQESKHNFSSVHYTYWAIPALIVLYGFTISLYLRIFCFVFSCLPVCYNLNF